MLELHPARRRADASQLKFANPTILASTHLAESMKLPVSSSEHGDTRWRLCSSKPIDDKTSSIATLHTNVSMQLFLETRTGHGVTASWRAGFGSSVYNEIMLVMRESSSACHVVRSTHTVFTYVTDVCCISRAELRISRPCTMIGAATVAALLPG